MIKIHNATTGEIIEREMTDEELAQNEADLITQAKWQKAVDEKEAAKQAVLDKLGLTADEVAALLG
jgi:hypothetical protein